jgi:SAM-dependent methyltransferase
MPDPIDQRLYWDTTGAAKTFTHPLHTPWLNGINRGARVLDYGCGYGRVTAELRDLGFDYVTGVDPSPALIARGHRESPGLDLRLLESPPALPYPAASFEVIVLFAVLTCVPGDDAQRALVAELGRVLAPDGLIYVSDLLLRPGDRRYTGPAGVFRTNDGALCRHHDIAWLRELFDVTDERRLEVTTMNGHRSPGVQLLARAR